MICSGVCLRRAIVMILPSPTIVGNGLTSQVDRFQGVRPRELEWQHGYASQGTHDGLLENVQAYNVYGDFVEAQHDSRLNANVRKAPPAVKIVVRNSRFETAAAWGLL